MPFGPALMTHISSSIELEEIVSKQCDSHELIDDALRAYLGISAEFKGTQHTVCSGDNAEEGRQTP